jgi:hypothetical protein
VEGRARSPRSHSHGGRDQRKKHPGNLQPDHARKSHDRCNERRLRLPPRCAYSFSVGNPAWFGGRSRLSGSGGRHRRSFGRRVGCARRFCSLYQRLCGVPRPVPQSAAELHPIHKASLRVRWCNRPVAKRITRTCHPSSLRGRERTQ